jgi:hypothetical protein
MLITASDQVIDRTLGTNIGDMTGSGGLAAGFDGNTDQALASSATKSSATLAYIGKTLASSSRITRAVVFGSNNQGYVNSINPAVQINVYGKTGAAPANSTDGTVIGTGIAFTDTADESENPRTTDVTIPGPWDHVWVRITHNGAANTMAVAEVMFFEEWEPELEEGASEDNPLFGYHNVVTSSILSTISEDADFPVTNLANPSTALKWVASSAALQAVTIDVSGLGEIDYVGIAKHNFDIAGTSLILMESTGSQGFAEIASSDAPTDDSPIIFRFAPKEVDQIRLVISAGSVAVEAAVLYAGLIIQMQQGIQAEHVPLPRAYIQDVVNGRSESGNFLGRIVTGARFASTASFANIEQDWYFDNLHPIALEGYQDPFFWVYFPEDRPEETAFAWMVNDPQPSEDLEHTVAFDFDMVGVA